ncbi:MAG: MarR family transcriptional regulator [Woeseiaceae bacterium]
MATQEFSQSLPMMLYRALDTVMPRFRKIFNEFGLTEQQWRVLRVLWEHGEVAFNELSAATLIPAPSLVGVVDRLTKNGLVERRRSDSDRRKVAVLATHKGKDLEGKVTPRVNAAYAELRDAMDAQEWQQLIDGLERVASMERSPEQEMQTVINQ